VSEDTWAGIEDENDAIHHTGLYLIPERDVRLLESLLVLHLSIVAFIQPIRI